jgi:hypothetical protein
MKGFKRVLAVVALVALVPSTGAQAVPVTHNLALTVGETKTWAGTPSPGANLNYNGLIDESTARGCSPDPQMKCEYALLALTNPVPADDLDGKLRRNVTVTLDEYTLPSPLSDFAVSLYETDATGSVRGNEVGTSDNTEVPDPDEQVMVSVTTTTANPTAYYLVEVAYFLTVYSGYRGTVKF